jgi:hypothetical protein
MFPDGNFPASALITVSNFAAPGMMLEIRRRRDRRPLLEHEPLFAAVARRRIEPGAWRTPRQPTSEER